MSKAKHAPCSCGCGEMADECMSGGPALGAFSVGPAWEPPAPPAQPTDCQQEWKL